jgi:hypothetical protein
MRNPYLIRTTRPLTQTQQRMSRIAQALVFDAGAIMGLALMLKLESPGLLQSVLYPAAGGCLGYLGACGAKVWFDWLYRR